MTPGVWYSMSIIAVKEELRKVQKMRFIQDFIASLVKVVQTVVAVVALLIFVPRSDLRAISKMRNDGKITDEQAFDFLKEYVSYGGRFGETRLDSTTRMAQLGGYGTSILGVSNFIKDYLK